MLVFKQDFLCHSVEVSGGITGEVGGETGHFSCHPLEGDVGEILCKHTSSGSEHHDQTIANQLVFLAGRFRIRTEPIQELFESDFADGIVPLSTHDCSLFFLTIWHTCTAEAESPRSAVTCVIQLRENAGQF